MSSSTMRFFCPPLTEYRIGLEDIVNYTTSQRSFRFARIMYEKKAVIISPLSEIGFSRRDRVMTCALSVMIIVSQTGKKKLWL